MFEIPFKRSKKKKKSKKNEYYVDKAESFLMDRFFFPQIFIFWLVRPNFEEDVRLIGLNSMILKVYIRSFFSFLLRVEEEEKIQEIKQ